MLCHNHEQQGTLQKAMLVNQPIWNSPTCNGNKHHNNFKTAKCTIV